MNDRYAREYAEREHAREQQQEQRRVCEMNRQDPGCQDLLRRLRREPPPPRAELQPPRLSAHAEWIPGHWPWNGDDFGWLGGFWLVPESDRAGGATATAPREPPAPRAEAPPAKPDPRAVWTDGHWQWDGGAFVWVTGLWRLPPTGASRWRSARWVRQGAVVRFDPGDWSR